VRRVLLEDHVIYLGRQSGGWLNQFIMIRSRQRPSSMANGGSNSAECGCCSNHDVGSASPDNNTCTTSPASSQSSARSATSHSVPRNIRHKRTTAQRIIAIRHILSLIASIIFFSSVGLMLHYPQISNRLIMLHEASSPLPFLTQFVQQSSFSSCEAPAEASFTLVTQCSDDRLWMMEYHCQRWSVGNERPMLSLVVYTNSTVDEIIKSYRQHVRSNSTGRSQCCRFSRQ
jgi:hypothetical protein